MPFQKPKDTMQLREPQGSTSRKVKDVVLWRTCHPNSQNRFTQQIFFSSIMHPIFLCSKYLYQAANKSIFIVNLWVGTFSHSAGDIVLAQVPSFRAGLSPDRAKVWATGEALWDGTLVVAGLRAAERYLTSNFWPCTAELVSQYFTFFQQQVQAILPCPEAVGIKWGHGKHVVFGYFAGAVHNGGCTQPESAGQATTNWRLLQDSSDSSKPCFWW